MKKKLESSPYDTIGKQEEKRTDNQFIRNNKKTTGDLFLVTNIENAFTVDVEDYYHVSAFSTVIKKENWDNYQSRVVTNTNKILSILDNNNVKGTFFILGWVAERQPDLVSKIKSCGHEIACHGMSHQLIYNQKKDVFREETHKAKSILEDIIQEPILGYRAASYSITKKSMWALDILVDEGFQYDSSIFPVLHDRYGIPGAPRFPYEIITEKGNKITEFPLSTIELGRFRIPVSGGGYFRLFPYIVSKAFLNIINYRSGEPFIFYLHPWEIDPDQPRVETSVLSKFRHYNNLNKTENRLKHLLNDFKFTTAKDILLESSCI